MRTSTVTLVALLAVFLNLQGLLLQELLSLSSLFDFTKSKSSVSSVDADRDCIFRYSPIYRSIYVYPKPLNASWPWIEIDRRIKREGIAHYDSLNKEFNQYTAELLVRDIITHPESCLQTSNPEQAKLFYVPYLPSIEYHNGSLYGDYKTSTYGQAVLDATNGKYGAWEKLFGLTSTYWQRRNGSDHILVMSEPLHGLTHPRNRRGNYHYIHSQRQLTPPIIISIELSKTFVEMYPNCANKNILIPYPNTDGKWFNGHYDQKAAMVELLPNNVVTDDSSTRAATSNNSATSSNSSISAVLDPQKQRQQRPLLQFYQAGNHGTCRQLRIALEKNYKCTKDAQLSSRRGGGGDNAIPPYTIGYRKATFCPCPGGDSPSAKRFFDAVHAGCIPVVLSHDFVWPSFLSENKPFLGPNNPQEFSIRLNAQDYSKAKYNHRCDVIDDATPLSYNGTTKAPSRKATKTNAQDLQSYLKTISNQKIQLLQNGLDIASDHYAYYKRDKHLPNNPLRDRVLPNGGAAHTLVGKLSERALGVLWPACQHEVKKTRAMETDKVNTFKC